MHGTYDVLMLHTLHVAWIVQLQFQSSISNAISSFLPSHPGIELHYSNPANDVNDIHRYVILEQMKTSLSNVLLGNVLCEQYSSIHKYRNVYEAIEDYQVESKCAMVSSFIHYDLKIYV